jgi:hypothetical protein
MRVQLKEHSGLKQSRENVALHRDICSLVLPMTFVANEIVAEFHFLNIRS